MSALSFTVRRTAERIVERLRRYHGLRLAVIVGSSRIQAISANHEEDVIAMLQRKRTRLVGIYDERVSSETLNLDIEYVMNQIRDEKGQ